METLGRERVLRALYGAAMGARPWPEALDRLAQYTSTRFVSLDSYDMNNGIGAVLASNMAPNNPVVAEYGRVNGTRNRLIERAFPHQYQGAILRSSQILPTRKFIETDIYHSLFKPLGMKHAAGITMDIGPGSMTHYSFIKPHDAPDFTDRELDRLRELRPDLTQVWMGFQHLAGLQSQLNSLTTLWDRFTHAVVVTDNQRRIEFANRTAERLFKASAVIASRSGKLRGVCAAVEAGLENAFKYLENGHRQISCLNPAAANKSGRLTATLIRLDSKRIAIVLTDPTASSEDIGATLQHCYQLTSTEAEVVQIILEGLSLRDYSDRHKISYETGRTHLKNAMRKNGWSRQTEMMSSIFKRLMPFELFRIDR